MRAGRLKDAAALIGSAGNQLAPAVLIGIEDKDESITFSEGLKSEAAIKIRSRWRQDATAGSFWLSGSRLFLINGSSNPDGKKRDLVCSCTELIGAPTLIVDAGETVKCALTVYKPKPDAGHNMFQAETERRQAEFANVQYKPVVGHEFNLAGALYRITEHDEKESDSVVSRCWVEFISYA